MIEYGTNPDKAVGLYFSWKPGDRMLIVWALGLQVEVYFMPRDWSFAVDKSFGLLSLGPICLNWSDDDLGA